MITMGSEPIPLPYRSWDEVPPEHLRAIVQINTETMDDAQAPPTPTPPTCGSKCCTILNDFRFRIALIFIIGALKAIADAIHRNQNAITDI